jgi:hypothetical protein
VIALEGRVDAENALAPSRALNIMEENRHHRDFAAQKFCQ